MKLCSHQNYLKVFNNEENVYNGMFKYIFACIYKHTFL